MSYTATMIGGPYDGVQLADPFPSPDIRNADYAREGYAPGRYVLVLDRSTAVDLVYRWRADEC